MNKLLSASEFWMAIFALAAKLLELVGVMDQNTFNAVILPALVYIVGRITSKVTKAKFGGASA